jgi:methionine synthase II (cobalamin-independent)
LPGDDPLEAARLVFGELPELPHLPELPGRGPGADVIGRSAARLVDLHVDRQPSGWRLVDRAGIDERRAASYLSQDLDALEEVGDGYRGPLKVSLAGPWTLAASLELPRGDKALSDTGAWRDIAESLAEAAREHVGEVRQRVPGAEVILQLDEPALPAVLAGRVPTASGYGVLRVVEDSAAEAALARVIDAAGCPVVVHCCAPGAPVELLRRARVTGVSLDASLLTEGEDEGIGEVVEAGVGLWLGVVPGTDAALPDLAAVADPARRLWLRLGLDVTGLADVVLTPACGLAGASPAYARLAMSRCREAARRLAEDPG